MGLRKGEDVRGIGLLLATFVLAMTLTFAPVASAHEAEDGEHHRGGEENRGGGAVVDWGASWLPPAFVAIGFVALGTVSYAALLRRGS